MQNTQNIDDDANITDKCFQFIIETSVKYNIDESHALKHSMQVLNFAKDIYSKEILKFPDLIRHKDIIYISALLHDMCDKKYVEDEYNSLQRLKDYMCIYVAENKLDVIVSIIATMSYSKVKNDGYPLLGEYMKAYHIVREADLLAAYDTERCIIYAMMKERRKYSDAVERCINLFNVRVLKYISDDLFTTEYGITKARELHENAIAEINKLKIFITST